MRSLAVALSLVALVACGGSQTPENEAPPERDRAADEEPAISEEERLLLAHQARQNDACEQMCTRLTECVVADTQEHAPEELEGVDVDALARHYKETRCLAPCEDSELSVRQVETMEECIEAGGTCEEFLDCLDAVQPQSG